MSILVFDVETTGLMQGYNPDYRDLRKFKNCRIVSICWNIYKSNGFLIRSRYHVIKPIGFSINNEDMATSINKITTEIADHGSTLIEVLDELSNDLATISTIVAHNLKFDKTVLLSELHRLTREDIIMKIQATDSYCTMINSTELCQLSGYKPGAYKYPKLQELHHKLFGYNFVGAHAANMDVNATADCYFRLILQPNST